MKNPSSYMRGLTSWEAIICVIFVLLTNSQRILSDPAAENLPPRQFVLSFQLISLIRFLSGDKTATKTTATTAKTVLKTTDATAVIAVTAAAVATVVAVASITMAGSFNSLLSLLRGRALPTLC